VLFVTLRPPYHIRQLNRGLALQQEKSFQAAVEYFDRALMARPTMGDALYERARTKMLAGELDAAINEFTRLNEEFGDTRGLAYSGYCFNLMKQPAAAIDKYERSLADGFASSGLHNNLGVSYCLARSRLDYDDRFAEAERHLNRALELDSASLTVRRNLVELALQRLSNDPSYAPDNALSYIDDLVAKCPTNRVIWKQAALLYGFMSLQDRSFNNACLSAIRLAGIGRGTITKRELEALPAFQVVRSLPEFGELYSTAPNTGSFSSRRPLLQLMDPVATLLEVPASDE
jgi:tetratricopeptide (TPR) repeat protein